MNTPVSYPLAQLLKNKKLHILSSKLMYASNGELTDAIYDFDDWCFAPTIAEVVMYLYEKHGIWIGVQPTSVVGKFQFRTYYNNNGVMNQHFNNSMSKEFNSPIEAYEAAIIYTLNNLI